MTNLRSEASFETDRGGFVVASCATGLKFPDTLKFRLHPDLYRKIEEARTKLGEPYSPEVHLYLAQQDAFVDTGLDTEPVFGAPCLCLNHNPQDNYFHVLIDGEPASFPFSMEALSNAMKSLLAQPRPSRPRG